MWRTARRRTESPAARLTLKESRGREPPALRYNPPPMSSDRVTLEVSERGADQVGSRRVRRLRKEGLVPGVLYGKGHARAIVVKERELRTALTGPSGLHAIVDVVVEGQTTPHHAVLKDFQRHPIRGTITHVDLHEVRLDRPIQATVSVQLVGEAPGSKVGGMLSAGHARDPGRGAADRRFPSTSKPTSRALEVGDIVRVEDLAAIEGVTLPRRPDETRARDVLRAARDQPSSRKRPRLPRARGRGRGSRGRARAAEASDESAATEE